MRVFEQGSERWEIELREQLVITRRYDAGALIAESPAEHASPLRAKWEADRVCSRLVEAGFVRASGDGEVLGQAELEAALRANPDDLETHLVYADWLSDRGDDWGQLITIQHAIETLPRFGSEARRDELSRVEMMLQFRLSGRLWGRLGETIADEATQKYQCDLLHAEWRRGFVREVRIRHVEPFADIVTALAAAPAALVLASIGIEDEAWEPGTIEAFVTQPWPVLRELHVSGRVDARRLVPLFANAPQLARLVVDASEQTDAICAAVAGTRLEQLVLHDAAISAAGIAALASATLRELILSGELPAGAYARLMHVAPVVRVMTS